MSGDRTNAGTTILTIGSAALAQNSNGGQRAEVASAAGEAPLYDPRQFPTQHGQVLQFTQTPRGEIDGLILTDGTEVKTPPHLSTQIAYSVGAANSPGTLAELQSRVRMSLHGPQGDVNGALLEDGTVLRLPPPEANRFAALLQPGQPLVAEGVVVVNAIGKVFEAQQIGASRDQLLTRNAARTESRS